MVCSSDATVPHPLPWLAFPSSSSGYNIIHGMSEYYGERTISKKAQFGTEVEFRGDIHWGVILENEVGFCRHSRRRGCMTVVVCVAFGIWDGVCWWIAQVVHLQLFIVSTHTLI